MTRHAKAWQPAGCGSNVAVAMAVEPCRRVAERGMTSCQDGGDRTGAGPAGVVQVQGCTAWDAGRQLWPSALARAMQVAHSPLSNAFAATV